MNKFKKTALIFLLTQQIYSQNFTVSDFINLNGMRDIEAMLYAKDLSYLNSDKKYIYYELIKDGDCFSLTESVSGIVFSEDSTDNENNLGFKYFKKVKEGNTEFAYRYNENTQRGEAFISIKSIKALFNVDCKENYSNSMIIINFVNESDYNSFKKNIQRIAEYKETLKFPSGFVAEYQYGENLGFYLSGKDFNDFYHVQINLDFDINSDDFFTENKTIQSDDIQNDYYQNNSYNQDTSAPFNIVEDVPLFPGCESVAKIDRRKCFQEKMNQHIRDNFYYPPIAQEMGIQGRVYIQFIISESGYIENLRVRGPDRNLEKAAIDIINKLPRLIPGKSNNVPVRVPYSIPITFKLQRK